MSNITVLIVEKSGNIKEQTIKSYDEAELYKKAGYKTADGFKSYTTWNIDDLNGMSYSLSVFGKTTGRANQENKFEFPPPIDNTLFFGSCIIVNKPDDVPTSITQKEWEDIYDYLYGGFDDLDENDSEESSDEDDGVPRTKAGYVKDGFVVDDDEVVEEEAEEEVEEEVEEEEEEEEAEEDEEEDEYVKKSKKSSKKKKITKKPVPKAKAAKKTKKVASADLTTVFKNLNANDENYLDCTSELKEEEYI